MLRPASGTGHVVMQGSARGGAPAAAFVRPSNYANDVAAVSTPSVDGADFGRLFRDLRRALEISPHTLADHVGTTVDVIAALEASNVMRLPLWPETFRVVTQVTQLVGVDPAPVLTVIYREMQAHAASFSQLHRTHAAQHAAGVDGYLRGEPVLQGAQPRDLRPGIRERAAKRSFVGLARGFSALSLERAGHVLVRVRDLWATGRDQFGLDAKRLSAVGALLLIVLGIFAQGSALQASLATLNPPLASLMRSAQDYLLMRAAPVREGLRWIEVDDPRSRRTNRLQSGRAS